MFLTFPNQLFKFNHQLLDCDLVVDTRIESPDIPWDSFMGRRSQRADKPLAVAALVQVTSR